jgi:hypothetical protein
MESSGKTFEDAMNLENFHLAAVDQNPLALKTTGFIRLSGSFIEMAVIFCRESNQSLRWP